MSGSNIGTDGAWITIRVYGLLIHPMGDPPVRHVLVADEIIKGRMITKFPGGGLEYGEGLKECLVREIREELGVEANDLRHFHTTDHFQQSAFHSRPMQVLSIYYCFNTPDPLAIPLLDRPFAYTTPEQKEGFRWLALDSANEAAVTLPIDRIVLRMLKERSS